MITKEMSFLLDAKERQQEEEFRKQYEESERYNLTAVNNTPTLRA